MLSSASDSGIDEGPIVCKITDNGKNTPDPFLCAQPAVGNRLNITLGTFLGEATLAVTGSPLILVANGAVGQLVIQNTSTDITATNISADFTGTALDGNVTETGNTCAQLVPGGICTLTFTPGATVVPQTNFPIFGDNTGTITAAIQVSSGISLTSVTPNSGSSLGQTGVTLRGTVLNGVTGVTFGGTAATNVTVVNSTTVTAVTPLHDAGAVDVTVTTGAETSTLVNGYTYNAIALGQSTGGGVIACLNTGNLLIVTNDNLPSGRDGFGGGNRWGGNNINVTGTNNTAGATNTQIIVNCLTNGIGAGCTGGIPSANYAAGICSNYEIDSQGHSPCQAGNACYNDWFLPAGFNTTDSGQLNCIWTNRASIPNLPTNNFYWSSTQATASDARRQSMANGTEATDSKLNQLFVRCVRSFTTP